MLAISKLGSGATSSVYIGEYNNNKVALKRMNTKDHSLKKILKEIEILKTLSNLDCVIKFQGHRIKNKENIKDTEHVIITDYLEHYINFDDYINEILIHNRQGVENIIIDLCTGLKAIHDHNIVHRDVKPANILISRVNLKIKYLDFGYSRLKTDTDNNNRCGTRKYMDPLLCTVKGYRSDFEMLKKSDIYSLACTVFEMFYIYGSPFSIFYKLYKKKDKSLFDTFNLEDITDNNNNEKMGRHVYKIYANIYKYKDIIKIKKINETMNDIDSFCIKHNINFNCKKMFSENFNERYYYV